MLTTLKLSNMQISKKLQDSLQNLLTKQPSIEKLILNDCWLESSNDSAFPIPAQLKIIYRQAAMHTLLPAIALHDTNKPLNLTKFSYKGKLDDKSLQEALINATSLYALKLILFSDIFTTDELKTSAAQNLTKTISSHTQLITFSLTCHKMAQGAFAELAEGISHLTSLSTLDLWYNNFDDNDVKIIANLLPLLPLKTLKLDLNRIKDISSLTCKLLETTSLTSLDLRNNLIGDNGAVLLAKCLGKASLLNLDLAYNGIGEEGMMALASMLASNSVLLRLWLGELCGRVEAFYKEKEKKLQRPVNLMNDQIAMNFAAGLKNNSCLNTLSLPGYCHEEGATALAQVLNASTNLQRLYISQIILNYNAQDPFKNNPQFSGSVANKKG